MPAMAATTAAARQSAVGLQGMAVTTLFGKTAVATIPKVITYSKGAG